VEAAEVGCEVILVEKEASLGGRVLQSHRYFPKMCPPPCGFEINSRRIRQNPRITVYTLATVEDLKREGGQFQARIRKLPRYVTGNWVFSDELVEGLTSERPDDFNLGMKTTKALYYPHDMAYPPGPLLDREALSEADEKYLREKCPEGAIDWDAAPEEIEIEAGAVILATGWRPFDAARLDNLGYGRYANVITNVMMERLAAVDGPTGGRIQRPSDGKAPQNVAFVQCAGSRDENHLAYCSAVCCMASLKQIRYLREADPDSRATVFYIDVRTIGRLEKFYYSLLDDPDVSFFKGKVASIEQIEGSGNLHLEVEDTLAGKKPELEFDLVVLATGIVPNTDGLGVQFELGKDEYGFVDPASSTEGVFTAGCARSPCDVSQAVKESTAAALKAIQYLKRRGIA